MRRRIDRGWCALPALALVVGLGCKPVIERVSLGPAGDELNGPSSGLALSAEGDVAVFATKATNVPDPPAADTYAVYVNDRRRGTVTRLDSTALGGELNYSDPVLSADGTSLVFSVLSDIVQLWILDRTTGAFRLVSATPAGQPGNGPSYGASISADGSLVAFHSFASDLVPLDTNGTDDVFVWSRASGAIELVSQASDGTRGNGSSSSPSMSSDGRLVAFGSIASNLDPTYPSPLSTIYLRDRMAGITRVLVGSPSGGPQIDDTATRLVYVSICIFPHAGCVDHALLRGGPGGMDMPVPDDGGLPRLSANGRSLAFATDQALLPEDGNGEGDDVYVNDLTTGALALASIDGGGVQANAESHLSALSPDGASLLFSSAASNLVSGDTNGVEDVFVRINPLTN